MLFRADRTLAWLADVRGQEQSVGGGGERKDKGDEEEEDEDEDEEGEDRGGGASRPAAGRRGAPRKHAWRQVALQAEEEEEEEEQEQGEWNNERQLFSGPGGRNIRDIRDGGGGGGNLDPGFGAEAPQERGLTKDVGRVWQMGRRDFPMAVKNGNSAPLYGNGLCHMLCCRENTF